MLFQCLYYLCYFNMKTAFGRFNQNERNALLTQAVYIITAHPLMLYWQLCKAVPWMRGFGISFSPGQRKLLFLLLSYFAQMLSTRKVKNVQKTAHAIPIAKEGA